MNKVSHSIFLLTILDGKKKIWLLAILGHKNFGKIENKLINLKVTYTKQLPQEMRILIFTTPVPMTESIQQDSTATATPQGGYTSIKERKKERLYFE